MLHTLQQIKNRAESAGNYFFSPATLRFFGSRVSGTVYPVADGAFFVTSESSGENLRRFSLRRAYDDGRTETVGEFRQYRTRDQAHRAAQRAAKALRDED